MGLLWHVGGGLTGGKLFIPSLLRCVSSTLASMGAHFWTFHGSALPDPIFLDTYMTTLSPLRYNSHLADTLQRAYNDEWRAAQEFLTI